MRFLITMILVSGVLNACGEDKVETAKVANLCSGVTDTNWRRARWQKDEKSRDQCEYSLGLRSDNSGNTRPCTLGGMPFMCMTRTDGSVALFSLGGVYAAEIDKADVERIGNGLVIIK